jgi:hypothetical protein
MSADYYIRLEQARSPQPSVQMLAALTRALRLTIDERDHLYLLAGHRPPEGARAGEYLRPSMLYLLDRLDGVPVQILSDLGICWRRTTWRRRCSGAWARWPGRTATSC